MVYTWRKKWRSGSTCTIIHFIDENIYTTKIKFVLNSSLPIGSTTLDIQYSKGETTTCFPCFQSYKCQVVVHPWRVSSLREPKVNLVGVSRSSPVVVDIIDRDSPVRSITHFAKGFLYGRWFIHGKLHFRLNERRPM